MTSRDLCIILLRIIAITFFAAAVTALPLSIRLFHEISSIPVWAQAFLELIIAVILWFFADIVADQVTRDIDPAAKLTHYTLEEIQVIVIALVGLYLLVHSLPDFIIRIFMYLKPAPEFTSPMNSAYVMRYKDSSLIINYGIKVLLGCVLLFKPQTVSNLIPKKRI